MLVSRPETSAWIPLAEVWMLLEDSLRRTRLKHNLCNFYRILFWHVNSKVGMVAAETYIVNLNPFFSNSLNVALQSFITDFLRRQLYLYLHTNINVIQLFLVSFCLVMNITFF